MKILHVADYLPGLHSITGGAEYAALHIIQQQVADGHEVRTFTRDPDRVVNEKMLSANFHTRVFDDYQKKISFAIKQMFYPFDFIAARQFQIVIKKIKPDVIHFHNLHYLGINLIASAKRRGIPTVVSIYDYWLLCPGFMLITSGKENCRKGHGDHCADCIGKTRIRWVKIIKKIMFGFRKKMFREHFMSTDIIVVLSAASGKMLQEHGYPSEKIKVIPTYLWEDAANADGSLPFVSGRIVYVGWIEQRKGALIAVRAFLQIAEMFPHATLELWGPQVDAHYKKTVLSVIESKKLSSRILLKGSCSREQMLTIFAQANMVIIPEQWENMSPVVLTEAMAASKCVVASNIGGMPEFIENGVSGYLAQHDSPEKFAEQIKKVLSDDALCKKIGKTARRNVVKMLEPEVINQKMHNVYAEIKR